MQGKRILAISILFFSLIQLGFSLFKNWGRQQDFATDYYAARAVVLNKTYDGKQGEWIYPKAGLLQFVPLAILDFNTAQIISTAISLISLFLSILLLSLETRLSLNQRLVILALAGLAFPVKFNLGMGQVNLYILLLAVSSWILVRRERYVTAGVIYGISLLIKPILVLPLLVWFLKKQFKVLFWAAVVITIGLLAGGQNYLRTASDLSKIGGKGFYYNQSLLGTINRLTPGLGFKEIIYLSICLIFLVFVCLRPEFGLTVLIDLLLFPVVWQHSLVFLIIPLIMLFKQVPNVILLGVYLLLAINIKDPNGVNPVILSHGTLGMLLLLGAYLWKRPILVGRG